MNKLVLGTITAAAVAAASVAAPAYARSDVEYAKVVDADPIYRTVRISQPRQECYDERVVYREEQPTYRSGGASPAGVLLGAALGGVAGHQFGKGRGNAVATAAGALIGAGIAQNHGGRSYQTGGGYTERVAYEPRCTTYDDYRTEQRVEGYDVTYRYNGRTYHTRMDHDPGSHIPVNVDVSPAGRYDY